MLIYKTGNLTKAIETIIVHGCNAQGVMGSGVAKDMRAAFPAAYATYTREHRTNGLMLGDVVWEWVQGNNGGSQLIGNAITQENFGRSGERYVDYEAVRVAFEEVRRQADLLVATVDHTGPLVAIPKIGAGLGGGDWTTIAGLIEDTMGDHDVVVYEFNG